MRSVRHYNPDYKSGAYCGVKGYSWEGTKYKQFVTCIGCKQQIRINKMNAKQKKTAVKHFLRKTKQGTARFTEGGLFAGNPPNWDINVRHTVQATTCKRCLRSLNS